MDNTIDDAKFDEILKSHNITPKATTASGVDPWAKYNAAVTPTPTPEPSLMDTLQGKNGAPVTDGSKIVNGGIGVVKSLGDTAVNTADMISGGLQKIGVPEGTFFTPTQEDISKTKDVLAAKTPEQDIGKKVGEVGQYLIPGEAGLKAPGTANFLTKALVEGLGSGAISTLQSGDVKTGTETGLLSGGISALMGAPGAIARSLGIPEKLYSTIFKNNMSSMMQELKSSGTQALEKTNPELFKSLVDSGVVVKATDGTVHVNESLAKQALERGLSGSIENMSNTVVHGLLTSEQKARQIAQNAPALLAVPEKQFGNVFSEIAKDYENVGFGEFAQKAAELQKKFSAGEIDATSTLEARRLLDGLRIRSSFMPDTKLSLSQDNLKFLADKLRDRVNKIPGMGEVMKDYSFNIQALESLAKEAVKRGNTNIVSLVEGTLLGSGSPIGAGIFAGKKLLNTPAGVTTIGKAIAKPAEVSNVGQAIRGATSNALVK